MKEDQHRDGIKAKKSKKTSLKPNVDESQIEKYARGSTDISTDNIKSVALKSRLQHSKESMREAAISTEATEILLPAEAGYIELENNMKEFKLKQKDISDNVDLNTARSAFDFQLQTFGPYCINYSRNGR